MRKQAKAYLYASAAVLLWATVATAFKISLRHLAPLQLLFYASVASSIALFFILSFQKKLVLLKEFSRKDYLRCAFLGLLNPLAYYAILFEAYRLLPAQQAQPINMTWPIVLVLLSIPILRQKIGFLSIVAIFVSFFGVLILSTQGDIPAMRFTSLKGVLLALASTIFWSLYWILNMKDKRGEVARLFVSFAFGTMFALVAVMIYSKIDLSNASGLLCGAYVGLFEMGITFVLWLKALKTSRTTAQVSNLIYVSPFLSLIPIHFIAGENIHPSSVIGLIFIIAGIFIQQIDARKTKR